jgi:hypothetical protein
VCTTLPSHKKALLMLCDDGFRTVKFKRKVWQRPKLVALWIFSARQAVSHMPPLFESCDIAHPFLG